MPFPPIFDPLFSKERILVSSGLGVSNPETKAKRNAKAAKVSGTHHDDHSVDHNKYKTRLCRNWKETGKCPYGDTCVYAHGAKEMRCREQAFLNVAPPLAFSEFPLFWEGVGFWDGKCQSTINVQVRHHLCSGQANKEIFFSGAILAFVSCFRLGLVFFVTKFQLAKFGQAAVESPPSRGC